MIKKKLFYLYLKNSEIVQNYIKKFDDKFVINNSKLSATASRVTVPKEFKPYRKIIEKRTKKEFTADVKFSVDEVKAQDKILISDFSVINRDFSALNLDLLLRAGFKAGVELGIISGSYRGVTNLNDCVEKLPKNTSSGFPYFKQKKNEFVRDDSMEWTEIMIKEPSLSKIMFQPAAVFHRFQYKLKEVKLKDGSLFNEIKKKIRPIWGTPFRTIVFESWIFRSVVSKFVETCVNNEHVICTTGRTKKDISKNLILKLRQTKFNTVSVDYTRFDSTVPNYFWCLFYAMLHEHLLSDSEIKEKHLFCMFAFHCFTPYCWNSTKLCFHKQGVPSGCLITSMFNTWVNRTVINYCYLEKSNGSKFAENKSCSLGDDLIFLDDLFSLSYFVDVTKRFGFNVDITSCVVTNPRKDSIPFIGYLWDIKNRPYQLENWYIAHLIMPGSFVRNSEIPISLLQTYRGISICMVLYNGMKMFDKLIGLEDFVFKELYNDYINGKEPIIKYVGRNSEMEKVRIPLSLIYTEGWEAF